MISMLSHYHGSIASGTSNSAAGASGGGRWASGTSWHCFRWRCTRSSQSCVYHDVSTTRSRTHVF